MAIPTPLPISVTIIARNEETKIARAIRSVRWVDEILVVDSGSTDQTREIAKSLGARVIFRPWLGYGKQKNLAQALAKNDWVFNLDADEAVSEELAAEIQMALRAVDANSKIKGFSLPRKTYFIGQWIRHGGWYPNYLVRLADRKFARWTEPPVHEELKVDGEVGILKSALDHDSFSSIDDQVSTNLNFSKLGSEVLRASGQRGGLLKLVLKPPGKFIETYFLKAGFLDGLRGFVISVNAAYSIFLKYAYLMESRMKNADLDHRQ